MDHIVKLALDFDKAVNGDDIELREMNDYVQAYLFNMLGLDAGRYWAITPLTKNSDLILRRAKDGVVELVLHDFHPTRLQQNYRWDIDIRTMCGRQGPAHIRAARKQYLSDGIKSIILVALRDKYKGQEFRVKVSIDKDLQATRQW